MKKIFFIILFSFVMLFSFMIHAKGGALVCDLKGANLSLTLVEQENEIEITLKGNDENRTRLAELEGVFNEFSSGYKFVLSKEKCAVALPQLNCLLQDKVKMYKLDEDNLVENEKWVPEGGYFGLSSSITIVDGAPFDSQPLHGRLGAPKLKTEVSLRFGISGYSYNNSGILHINRYQQFKINECSFFTPPLDVSEGIIEPGIFQHSTGVIGSSVNREIKYKELLHEILKNKDNWFLVKKALNSLERKETEFENFRNGLSEKNGLSNAQKTQIFNKLAFEEEKLFELVQKMQKEYNKISSVDLNIFVGLMEAVTSIDKYNDLPEGCTPLVTNSGNGINISISGTYDWILFERHGITESEWREVSVTGSMVSVDFSTDGRFVLYLSNKSPFSTSSKGRKALIEFETTNFGYDGKLTSAIITKSSSIKNNEDFYFCY